MNVFHIYNTTYVLSRTIFQLSHSIARFTFVRLPHIAYP